MKTFSARVAWNHKGTKYPHTETVVVEATSFMVAAHRAIKQIKKANRSTWKEPVGSSIRVDILISDNGKEADDGRGRRIQLAEES